jgi:hypothetical protein
MDEKITIIEGPSPTFEAVEDSWVLGLNDSPTIADVAVTHLRTFNGPALVERCHRAWRNQQPIHLEFRTSEGLEHSAPILAARYVETDEGQVLILWVRLAKGDAEIELAYEEDDEFDNDDDEYVDDEDDEFADDDEDDEGESPLDWTM